MSVSVEVEKKVSIAGIAVEAQSLKDRNRSLKERVFCCRGGGRARDCRSAQIFS